jgi:hypothetical protein
MSFACGGLRAEHFEWVVDVHLAVALTERVYGQVPWAVVMSTSMPATVTTS